MTAAVPTRLSVISFNDPDRNPTMPPPYVSARVLGANTHEEITVPAGASYVRLAGTTDFYAAYGATPVAIIPADLDDGNSNELIKLNDGSVWRSVNSVAKISVIATGVCTVTASFYTA